MKQSEILKQVQALGGNEFDFDQWYADCWSKKKGGYSAKLANNVISYLKQERKVVSSVLDICSGSGEFVSILRNICMDCIGIDVADSYLNYAKSKCNDVEFKKVDSLNKFNIKKKFDFISCNGDVVNMFTTKEAWETFFKTVNSHLNKTGLFLFDFYTKETLDGFNGVVYEEGEDLDYISKRSQHSGLCVMSEIYYLKESSLYYRKTSDIMVETSFETAEIIKMLEDQGFKNIKFVDISLTEIPKERIKEYSRLHILATK